MSPILYPLDSTNTVAYQVAQKTFDAAGPDAARKLVYQNPRRYMALV
jgi:hypothetical protein